MTPEDRIGMLIRCNHPWAFRRGQWGKIVDTVEVNGRPCYWIEWDGATGPMDREDQWPVDDPGVEYEFAVIVK